MSNNGSRKSQKNVDSCNVQSRDGTQELNLKKMAQFYSSCNPFLSWPASKAKDTDTYY